MAELERPKISIIVPVYNSERTLPKCVDSIISQTLTSFELLLINDGSLDNSGKICDEYSKIDSRIHVYHKANGGVSSARNLGLDNAKGEWIVFVDSDDWIKIDHIEIVTKKNSDIIFIGYKEINEKDNTIIREQQLQEYIATDRCECVNLILKAFKDRNFGFTWCKFFKRSIIEDNQLRFKKNISIREDEVFTFEYCNFIKSAEIYPYNSYYYVHSRNSLMHQKFISPREMRLAFTSSRQACKLNLNKEQESILDAYYLDSLLWCSRMMYTKGNRSVRVERIGLLKEIFFLNKKNETKSSQRFCIINPLITDIVNYIKSILR